MPRGGLGADGLCRAPWTAPASASVLVLACVCVCILCLTVLQGKYGSNTDRGR